MYDEDQKKPEIPHRMSRIAFPKAKQILISSIRDLRKTLYLKSHIQGRKTVLIFDAHLLSIGQGAAGNALLKILEEPPNNTTLILVTDYKEQLLPTLSSRCQQVNFPPLDPEVMTLYLEKMGISSELVPVVTEISQGNMHRAYSLLDKSTENILFSTSVADSIEHEDFDTVLNRKGDDFSKMDKRLALDMMRKEMLEASDDLKFEKAAKLRDEIKKLEKELEGIF